MALHPPILRLLRLSAALSVALLMLSCSHDTRVTLQEHLMAPQLNNLRSRVEGAKIQATPRGSTYESILDAHGLPLLIHVEGQLCTPWDSCKYESMYFMYRTRESWTCKLTFAGGTLDRDVECVPELVHLILGPGDVDPRSGRTAEPEQESATAATQEVVRTPRSQN